MRALEAQGLGGLVAAPPQLSDAARAAVHCWSFCGGWVPANWPIYAALYPVDDWHALVDRMLVIRNALAEKR